MTHVVLVRAVCGSITLSSQSRYLLSCVDLNYCMQFNKPPVMMLNTPHPHHRFAQTMVTFLTHQQRLSLCMGRHAAPSNIPSLLGSSKLIVHIPYSIQHSTIARETASFAG